MKKLFIFLALAILLVGSVSATVKSYDDKTNTVTIKNSFLFIPTSTIMTSTLNTPQIYKVGAGYGMVAKFTINPYEDYSNVLGEFELYNVKNNKKINRQIDVKYLAYENVQVPETYKTICSMSKNGTQECYNEPLTYKTEQKEVWLPFDNSIKTNEKVIIGLFTDVQVGDRVEWIPTIAGVKVQEWAVWTEDLNTNILRYYKMDEGSGTTLIDSTGTANGTVVGGLANITGKIGYGYNSTAATGQYANTNNINFTKTWTYSTWYKVSGAASDLDIWQSNQAPPGPSMRSISRLQRFYCQNGSATVFDTNFTATADTWTHSVLTYNQNTGELKAWANGELVMVKTALNCDTGGVLQNISSPRFNNGALGVSVDEVGIWNRILTDAEITQLYNSGVGITYSLPTELEVTLLSPENNSNFTTNSVNFSANVSDEGSLGIKNVSLIINGTINSTNTSTLEGLYGWTVAGFTDGYWNWSVIAYDDSNVSYTASNGTLGFNVDTTPTISITSPVNNTNYSTSSIDFNATSDLNVDYWIINYNGTNYTISDQTGTDLSETLTVEDGSHSLLIYANNSESGVWSLNDSISFIVDVTSPTLNITYPNETILFHIINTNLFLNWTVTDDNLDECWYNWNGTNVTVTCGDEYAEINITIGTNKNLTFYANDTFGNEASDFTSWNYLLFYNYETFEEEVLEGTSATFTANLLTNGTNINLAYLEYDGTNYTGTITNHGSNNFTLSRSLTAPMVDSDDTKDFSWFVYQGSFITQLDTQTQDVLNFGIDNCTTNTVVLYNFTIRDEADQTIINKTGNDTQAKVDLQIYSYGTSTLVQQFNRSYSQTNPFAICINSSLASGEQFNVYAVIEYKATGWQTEFYNIQNATINSTLLNQNISLYDLSNETAQKFKLIVKDSSFLAISDALIEIHRKYLDEGVYKIVELPKTDAKGETVASLVLNDVIYKFIIKKYGTTIATFDNVRAVCQTPLVMPCTIDFNAFASSITVPDFETLADFNFTIDYNETSRIVRSIFTIPSGTPTTVKLEVIREDALGTAVCEDTLTSTSGTLSCVVPNSFGNSTIRANLYKDDVFQATGQIKMDQKPSDIYGTVLVALALFIMLTLLGAGMSDNPVFTVLFFMVGIILLFALNLVEGGGFIGASATILWLIIAIIIVIIKGGNRS